MAQGINFEVALFIILGIAALIAVMAGLIVSARRRTTGVMAIGAFFSVFAPDPTFEQKIIMVEEAKAEQREEEGQGEPE